MRKLWEKLGIVIHFLILPVIKFTLADTTRTRVLIIAESKVLVAKTWISGGKWGMPGGGLHHNETKLDCAIREVREEVGIRLRPQDLKFKRELNLKDQGISVNLCLFKVNLPKAVPLKRQRLEIVDAQWLGASEVTEANSTPDLYMALREYRQEIGR